MLWEYPSAPPKYSRREQRRARRRRRMLTITLCALVPLLILLGVLAAFRGESGQESAEPPVLTPPSDAALSAPKTDKPTSQEDSAVDVAVPDWVTVDLLPVNEYSRPGTPLTQVNGVVVHYVGNPGTTAEQNRSYYASLAETQETWASSHFVIGIDGTVIQCVPLDEVAYCSNDRNSDTISIECCHPDESGEFTPATLDALTQLLNWLIDTYGLEREDILRHYDVTGKVCPRYFVDHPDAWEDFRDTLTF